MIITRPNSFTTRGENMLAFLVILGARANKTFHSSVMVDTCKVTTDFILDIHFRDVTFCIPRHDSGQSNSWLAGIEYPGHAVET